jgi:hypothetical protein
MSAQLECPNLDLGLRHKLRCIDPFFKEYMSPPKEWVCQWCLSDYCSCPVFLGHNPVLSDGFQIFPNIEGELLPTQ